MSQTDSFQFTRRHALEILAIGALSPAAMAADPFPTRALKIVVPYPPGSSTDYLARLLSDRLAEQLKQPVTVENKPGAGGVVGTQLLAQSAPDGYTITAVAAIDSQALRVKLRVPATITRQNVTQRCIIKKPCFLQTLISNF